MFQDPQCLMFQCFQPVHFSFTKKTFSGFLNLDRVGCEFNLFHILFFCKSADFYSDKKFCVIKKFLIV